MRLPTDSKKSRAAILLLPCCCSHHRHVHTVHVHHHSRSLITIDPRIPSPLQLVRIESVILNSTELISLQQDKTSQLLQYIDRSIIFLIFFEILRRI
jgi:hypothetical protein